MVKLILALSLLCSFVNAKTVSLDDMIAQMIVIGFDGSKEGDKWVDQVAKDIKREKIGGVILIDKNIQTVQQTKKLTDYLKAQAPKEAPLIVAVEYTEKELNLFGNKKEISGVSSPASMVAQKDLSEAGALYEQMAHDMANAGVNLNLAPVLDLQSKTFHSKKELDSSYSSYEEIVTTYATLFIDAMSKNRVASAGKYFPMAGSNLWDNFSSVADVTDLWHFEQLKPYYDLIATNKIHAVVVSHAINKALDPSEPALFSKLIIQKLLREKMHFNGIVIADQLRTNSVANGLEFKKRIIKTIQAGSDILIFSNYFAENASVPFTINKIITDAIHSGELKQEQIERSYERIMQFKQNHIKREVGNNAN